MKMTTTNYWVYMMDQMMMDSKRQARRKLGHAMPRAGQLVHRHVM